MPTEVKSKEVQESFGFTGEEAMGPKIITPGEKGARCWRYSHEEGSTEGRQQKSSPGETEQVTKQVASQQDHGRTHLWPQRI